ncbi:MAG TPA: cyclic nucleotide-binding domain-containing protein [Bauldia sp.]|nr:cyclic nucleotide-binding domain-containing protein [Bauldia sp.]
MTTPDIVGLLALVLLLAAAWAKPVEWLRGLSAVANLAMVAYGIITAQYPLALLSALILAVNAWRLYETRALVSVTRDATAASAAPITMDWLLPYMRPLALPTGTVVFNKDAPADAMYFISHGRIRFEEIGVEMGKGALFGEIGIFSHDKRRTATAKTLEDTALMQVSADKVRELYYQNPDFGFFIVDLITRRLMEDAAAGTLKP